MKKGLFTFSTLLIAVSAAALMTACNRQEPIDKLADRVFTLAEQQFILMDRRLPEGMFPRSLNPDGTPLDRGFDAWDCGFYPGSLWYVYKYTGNEQIREIADRRTRSLAGLPAVCDHHDIGFMIWCSYGNAWMETRDSSYLPVIKDAAKMLTTLYHPEVGLTRSWTPRPDKGWLYPVIIDNMMNLELLEQAYNIFGEKQWVEIAESHADKTMKNHFRPDYSCYHVVDYDPQTGAVRGKHNHQGYADESSWSRGQSWALYGYTMMYRFTSKPEYLEHAVKVADHIISRLPEDLIPFYDFDDPDIPNVYRDASAGAIIASGLVELSGYTGNKSYLKLAEDMVRALCTEEYLAPLGENGNFLLKHSVTWLAGNVNVDKPLAYADYYLLEALLRLTNKQ